MQKICTYCDQPFRSQRSNRKYCSDNCRQMAYYARNGFSHAQDHGVGSVDGRNYIQAPVTVKYNKQPAVNDLKYIKPTQTVKDIKQGSEQISDSLLETLADRILARIEERIVKKLEAVKYGLSDTVKHVTVKEPLNVKDRASVKHGFTSNTVTGNTDSTMCRVQPFTGLYSPIVNVKHDSDTVKDYTDIVKDGIDTVKYESILREAVPSVKDITDFTDESERECEHLEVQELLDDEDNYSADVEVEEVHWEDDIEEEQSEVDALNHEPAPCNLRQRFTVTADHENSTDSDQNTIIASANTDKDVIVKNVNELSANRKDDYEWVEPVICEEILYFIKKKRPHIDQDLEVLGTGNKRRENMKALMYSKCLIRNVLRLSNSPAINTETFVALANTLTKLVGSDMFASLPIWFDAYTSTICNLQSKLRTMGMACQGNEPVRIRLSRNMKARLMAIRFDLDYFVNDISFKEISLPG